MVTPLCEGQSCGDTLATTRSMEGCCCCCLVVNANLRFEGSASVLRQDQTAQQPMVKWIEGKSCGGTL